MMSASEAVAAKSLSAPTLSFSPVTTSLSSTTRGLPHILPFRMSADASVFPVHHQNGDVWNKGASITLEMNKEFIFSIVFSWGGGCL